MTCPRHPRVQLGDAGDCSRCEREAEAPEEALYHPEGPGADYESRAAVDRYEYGMEAGWP